MRAGGRRHWRMAFPGYFYLGQMMSLLVFIPFIPLVVLAWWITGGPNGDHVTTFWVVASVFGVLAVVLAGRLPAPWNGDSPDAPRSRSDRSEQELAAKRLLAERGSQLEPERANDVRLLLESGFAREAEKVLRAETDPSPPDDAETHTR